MMMDGVDIFSISDSINISQGLEIINGSSPNSSHNMTSHYSAADLDTLFYYYVLWSIAVPTIFGIIIVVGTIGNSLVIYVILSRRDMQTVTNILLLNLAVADLAFLVLCVPVTAYKYAAPSWPFGDFGCKLISYMIYVTAMVTVYTLVAISFLRYLTIIHNTATVKYRTKRNIVIINLSIWMMILLINIFSLLIHQLKVYDAYFAYCGMMDELIKYFFMVFFILGYALPLMIISLLYLLVLLHLNQKQESSISQTQERTAKASKVIILVIVIFMLSWLPQHVIQLYSAFVGYPQTIFHEMLRIFCNCMAYGNSCANPIIYSFVSQEFKKAFHEVIHCRKVSSNRYGSSSMRDIDNTDERTAMNEV